MDASDDDVQRLALSPQYALYRAIDRFFACRVAGRGSTESLHAVLACVDSIRDERYDAEIASIGNGAMEWDVMRCVLRLLRRKNLWLIAPRALQQGEELLAAIE